MDMRIKIRRMEEEREGGREEREKTTERSRGGGGGGGGRVGAEGEKSGRHYRPPASSLVSDGPRMHQPSAALSIEEGRMDGFWVLFDFSRILFGFCDVYAVRIIPVYGTYRPVGRSCQPGWLNPWMVPLAVNRSQKLSQRPIVRRSSPCGSGTVSSKYTVRRTEYSARYKTFPESPTTLILACFFQRFSAAVHVAVEIPRWTGVRTFCQSSSLGSTMRFDNSGPSQTKEQKYCHVHHPHRLLQTLAALRLHPVSSLRRSCIGAYPVCLSRTDSGANRSPTTVGRL
ncbi:hypothetical protein BDV59DRAFT_70637 [Aspergillus ambiguus]|uniref:uncharacterized protein n=1 Tax=Aspergillus ambiguus TaxID=176160 RepID=UPI003CCE3066